MAKFHKEFVGSLCFWCEKLLHSHNITRDHLIPVCMGGKHEIVPSCRECNEERGAVTEFYCHRLYLIEYIKRSPARITKYKNQFRKKVKKMAPLIVKWEHLHREKGVILPFRLLEIVRLDEAMPVGIECQ